MYKFPTYLLRRSLLAAAFVAAAIAPGLAAAADDPSALLLARRADVTSAEVVMLSFDIVFNRRQSERDVFRRGCWYDVVDRPALDALLDLLVSAEIVEDRNPLGDIDPRVVIQLKVEDKRLVKFIFERGMSTPIPGAEGMATPGGRVRANARFVADLRAWAAQQQPTSPCPD